ncbi:alpha/beta fold hydrolase [Leptospira noguchii]|uniref:Alpha/beta hydrolase family protein n=1 Tax=Leptospira noguchii serovar Panama str. CZ214 TaxID=1001595 RepID=T0GXM2_9LEPT|nr:alpha/beta hydrolase [Leptospira noguchii]EQA73667.1 alpha/beta hydrolase family protein [Leptospira noguchii serovar Panama str. CZ214]
MKNIYLISGLGADERIFQRLNFGNVNPRYISWIQPELDESLSKYSKRLLSQIDTKNEIILIGVSFGGIVALEISKHILVKQIIIISSIKSDSEKPILYRLFGTLRLINIVPSFLLKLYTPVLNYYFGITSKEDQELLKSFLANTNGNFLKWALKSILKWDNQDYQTNLIHLHGTNDRLLPFQLIKAPILISGGGHFMILNKAKEISSELVKILAD